MLISKISSMDAIAARRPALHPQLHRSTLGHGLKNHGVAWGICSLSLLMPTPSGMDMVTMQSITSRQTIEKLRNIFATHGLPKKVVTDNGPSFEFKEFMSQNGILHITSAPYHLSTNGLAVRAVRKFYARMSHQVSVSISHHPSHYHRNTTCRDAHGSKFAKSP